MLSNKVNIYTIVHVKLLSMEYYGNLVRQKDVRNIHYTIYDADYIVCGCGCVGVGVGRVGDVGGRVRGPWLAFLCST